MLSDSVRRSPSLFIDTISVYIENAARGAAHSNFHISMDPRVRDAFQVCFELDAGAALLYKTDSGGSAAVPVTPRYIVGKIAKLEFVEFKFGYF